MEFRPINATLIATCATTDRCTHCSLRIGCPIRHTFYGGDITVEIALQRAELRLRRVVGENAAFLQSDKLRHKILCERGENPGGYSYT